MANKLGTLAFIRKHLAFPFAIQRSTPSARFIARSSKDHDCRSFRDRSTGRYPLPLFSTTCLRKSLRSMRKQTVIIPNIPSFANFACRAVTASNSQIPQFRRSSTKQWLSPNYPKGRVILIRCPRRDHASHRSTHPQEASAQIHPSRLPWAQL